MRAILRYLSPLLLLFTAAHAQETIPHGVQAGGAHRAEGASVHLRATAGQPAIGKATGTYSHGAGFWYTALSIRVTAPAAGDRLQAGAEHSVAWNIVGAVPSVQIELSTTGGTSWTQLTASTSATGLHAWTIPDMPTTQALIRVSSTDIPDVYDDSGLFTIVPVAPPTNLAAVPGDGEVTLSWTASTSANVHGYSVYRGTTSGSLVQIATTASLACTDSGLSNGVTYYYALAALAGDISSARTEEVSALPAPNSLTVLVPNGGETITTGTTTTILWNSTGSIDDVAIELSVNNGCSWSTVAVVSNTGSYSWSVGDSPSQQALLRIGSTDTPSIRDESNGSFRILSGTRTAVQLKLFIEGAFSGAAMSTTLHDDGLLPTAQPFDGSPWNYSGDETIGSCVPAGSIVDWLLVECRATPAGATVARRAALLLGDGSVVNADGYNPVLFASDQLPAGLYYIVARHRNHMDVMSATAVTVSTGAGAVYDFSTSVSAAYQQFRPSTHELAVGVTGLPAGDVGSDGIVNAVDRAVIRNATGTTGYRVEDLTLDGIVNAVDRILVADNRFTVSQVP